VAIFLTPQIIAQVIVSGILAGALYAMIALGLSLIFGVMRVINVAHGALVMLGSYTTFWLFHLWGVDPLLSLLVSMPLLFLVGMVLQRVFVDRVVDAPELSSLLLTFGLSIAIANLAQYVWTADYRSVEYMTTSIRFAGLAFSGARMVSFALALLITLLAFWVLRFTKVGKAIRATSQSREVALVCGINVPHIYLITFGMAAALAAAGGSLVSIMFSIFPEMGDTYLVRSFVVIVLGGAGNYPGAFLGGIILGVTENLAALLLSAQVAPAVSYALMVLVLLLCPQGLFRGRAK
jgi:branched-chain amino acid transport system permease protein